MQPGQAHFLLNAVYLPGLKSEQPVTQAVLEAIPAHKSEYRPNEVSRSALDLALHIVAAEKRFTNAVLTGEFDFRLKLPEHLKDPIALSQWYAAEFAEDFAKLTELSDEELRKEINFRDLIQQPAVMFLGRQLHHTIHHRGQLTTYLRPMGARVPAIYGESYDSAAARHAHR